jgi:hypothetical protein
MLAYYGNAFSRSWSATWDWATGQGIYLTWLLAFGVVVCAGIFAVVRATRKDHSWDDAVGEVRKALGDFVIAVFGASVFVLLLMFCVFFVWDAPTQSKISQNALASLRTENSDAITHLNEENAKIIGKLNEKIVDLQSKPKIKRQSAGSVVSKFTYASHA